MRIRSKENHSKARSRRKVTAIVVLASLTILGMGTLVSQKTPEALADSTLARAVSTSSAVVDTGSANASEASQKDAQIRTTAGPLIKRIATEITVDGKTMKLDFISGATVADLVAKSGVKVGEDDILSIQLTEPLMDGMKVKLTRVVKKQDEVLKETEYETVYQDDDTLPEGETTLLQAGENEIVKEIYTVIMHDGKEVERKLESSEVVQEGQEEIIARGTMVVYEEEDSDDDSSDNESASNESQASTSTSSSRANSSSSGNSESSSGSDGVLTAFKGVHYGPSGKETYYNLSMDGIVSAMSAYGYSADDYWVREDGVKMLGDYVMVAANYSVHPKGSTVATSLGTGIVCDTGGFAYSNPTQLDIATNW